ncbi:MAG: histidine phosphatase family protein [Thermoplasmata archaeon]
MQVVVLRHGPAHDPNPLSWPDDRDRPLTEAGEHRVERVAAGLKRLLPRVGGFATSSSQRARRTAEIVRTVWAREDPIVEWSELSPGEPAEPILGKLARVAIGPVPWILVGHEPTLSEWVGLATCGEERSVVVLGRAGAACVDFEADVRPGGARVVWLLSANQLEDLGQMTAPYPFR